MIRLPGVYRLYRRSHGFLGSDCKLFDGSQFPLGFDTVFVHVESIGKAPCNSTRLQSICSAVFTSADSNDPAKLLEKAMSMLGAEDEDGDGKSVKNKEIDTDALSLLEPFLIENPVVRLVKMQKR